MDESSEEKDIFSLLMDKEREVEAIIDGAKEEARKVMAEAAVKAREIEERVEADVEASLDSLRREEGVALERAVAAIESEVSSGREALLKCGSVGTERAVALVVERILKPKS